MHRTFNCLSGRHRLRAGAAGLIAAALSLSACSDPSSTASSVAAVDAATGSTVDRTADEVVVASETTAVASTDPVPADSDSDSEAASRFYDSSTLHTISVTFDETAYDTMITTFQSTGDKEWIEARVTIDGVVYEQVGLRLKGNSSLMGLRRTGSDGEAVPAGPGGTISAAEPEGLPWLIRLDKFVDDQSHDGETEFVVRSSASETALNEAVAVELLDAAGLTTQDAAAVEFTVNDRPAQLRLVLQNPNDDWTEENLGTGLLYKADASGDYSYRGEDAAAYAEAWEQEAGADDLTPLIEFLDFVNNADDATFAAELGDRLDVEAFAEYLAIEDLLGNWDDISGPGNNSYLYYDSDAEQFTVVAWDHNLALSSGMGGMGGPPGAGTPPAGFDPTQLPTGATPPDGAERPTGGGGPQRSNPLVERFTSVAAFSAQYDEAYARLQAELYESGLASEILERWTTMLLDQATDLVDAATITTESEAIAARFE